MEVIYNIIDFVLGMMGTTAWTNASALLGHVINIFSAGFTLYMLYVIWGYYQKGVDGSVLEFTQRLFGWLLIIALAFNVGNYQKLAMLVYDLPEELSQVIAGSWAGDTKSRFQTMVEIVQKYGAWFSKAYDDAGTFESLAVGLCLIVVYILGYAVVAITMGLYLVSKASLALVLAFGPLFLGFLIFPTTRQWGMNWISQIFNYVLAAGLYTMITFLQFSVMGTMKSPEGKAFQLDLVLEFTSVIILVSLIMIPVIMSIPSLASALVGGATLSGRGGAVGSFVGGMAGGMASAGAKLASGSASAVLSRGTGMALRSANWASGGRLGKAGNTLINSGIARGSVRAVNATKGFFKDGGGRRLGHKSALEKSRMNNPSN
ncbi:type IV secretion system protein [Taylorella equigenitalis]|uniref:type IV secretion system protein n=1 Tax=Taylorella equigenitalis TaxID=29575 RepID=UPI00237C5C8F|nr:type IV secretion system protein [Taylorella equigenitalis]WDU48957.1 type IV secretion system protein [Taylorella equigenitalis]WDU51431.1 type IV secretion system protein [Taylorella equigenitalis]